MLKTDPETEKTSSTHRVLLQLLVGHGTRGATSQILNSSQNRKHRKHRSTKDEAQRWRWAKPSLKLLGSKAGYVAYYTIL